MTDCHVNVARFSSYVARLVINTQERAITMLFKKKIEKLHNLHMATTNLNTHLWIRIYNGFAIIPDLRQTGIAKNLALFGQKKICEFFSVPCLFICKKN